MTLLEKKLKELDWPDKKRSLFSDESDWWNMARIEIANKEEGFALMSQGYKDAGDRLVENAIEDRTSKNLLIFPILFLYRHYLELALKELILVANQYLQKGHKTKTAHNLSVLWNDTKNLLSEIELNIPKKEMDVVEYQILQFDNFDQRSMTFRYPVDTNDNVFKNLQGHINIVAVQKIISGLHAWNFGLVCVIGELESAKEQ